MHHYLVQLSPQTSPQIHLDPLLGLLLSNIETFQAVSLNHNTVDIALKLLQTNSSDTIQARA